MWDGDLREDCDSSEILLEGIDEDLCDDLFEWCLSDFEDPDFLELSADLLDPDDLLEDEDLFEFDEYLWSDFEEDNFLE